MSKVRFAPTAPINLVRLAIALAAVVATMAAMSSTALANSHSSSCSGVGNCTSLINIDHNNTNIVLGGNSILSDISLVSLENLAVIVSNNSIACNQIVALLSVDCSKDVANGILAIVPLSVKDVDVSILGGLFPYHKHLWG
jgi:hypothetical protein